MMPRKSAPKRLPKLSDAERHKCFVEMAREVEASEDPEEFDAAFKKVLRKAPAEAWKKDSANCSAGNNSRHRAS
jgi:hypothetical protein